MGTEPDRGNVVEQETTVQPAEEPAGQSNRTPNAREVFIQLRVGKKESLFVRVTGISPDPLFPGKVILDNVQVVSEGKCSRTLKIGGMDLIIKKWSVDKKDVENIINAIVVH